MIAGWGTGKTMCAILRGLLYSKLIPNNAGIIFRKEFTDLRDSTLKDFKTLTGIPVNSQRNAVLPNGSVIMFRHIEELNNIQNINLGWYFIEQAEELPTDTEFFLLWGRFKEKLQPTQEFIDLGLPMHSGFITGNVKRGQTWIRSLWKDDPNAKSNGFDLIEAITHDNIDVLSEDYLQRIELLKKIKPNLYRRFILNDWEAAEEDKFFHREWFEIVDASPVLVEEIRYWDRAATEAPKGKEVDASWTAGPKLGVDGRGVYYITDMVRFQGSPLRVEDTIKNVTSQDGHKVTVGIEQDPAQAGKSEAERYVRLLAGYNVILNPVRESKGLRITPVISQAEAGNVKLVRGVWNEAFLREGWLKRKPQRSKLKKENR